MLWASQEVTIFTIGDRWQILQMEENAVKVFFLANTLVLLRRIYGSRYSRMDQVKFVEYSHLVHSWIPWPILVFRFLINLNVGRVRPFHKTLFYCIYNGYKHSWRALSKNIHFVLGKRYQDLKSGRFVR